MRHAALAVGLVVLVLSAPADARRPRRPPRFNVTLAVDETWTAQVRVTNTTGNPIRLLSHADANGERHYDSLQIELSFPSPSREGCTGRHVGRTRKKLRFRDKRNRSAPVTVELAAGATMTHDIDLRAWAARAPNGRLALGRGFFKLRAFWTDASATAVSHEVQLTVDDEALAWTPKACQQNPGWDQF